MLKDFQIISLLLSVACLAASCFMAYIGYHNHKEAQKKIDAFIKSADISIKNNHKMYTDYEAQMDRWCESMEQHYSFLRDKLK